MGIFSKKNNDLDNIENSEIVTLIEEKKEKTESQIIDEMQKDYLAKRENLGDWDLEPKDFGPVWSYVADENVTDINLNMDGHDLWITDLNKGKYRVNPEEFKQKCDAWLKTQDALEFANTQQQDSNSLFVKQFVHRVGNKQSRQFNKQKPLLEAETGNLRISCVHSSAAVSGISICIRKTPPVMRITPKKALEQKYFTEDILCLLTNCVKAKMNFVFCGEPGVGKTECAKFFSQFINAEDRVITIEDNPELHYREINPGKDCVELKVFEPMFTYSTAIKACLRQNPQWIMLSEARSTEVKYLLECWSTGVSGFTTLHTDDVRKIPDRIQNMMGDNRDAERLENDIFSFVNIGILLRKKKDENGNTYRYIDQVCFFDRSNGKNNIVMMVENGQMIDVNGEKPKIPDYILKRLSFVDITDPYSGLDEILKGEKD